VAPPGFGAGGSGSVRSGSAKRFDWVSEMPQPKSSSSRGRSTAGGRRSSPGNAATRRRSSASSARAAEDQADASESIAEQLVRLLDPRELVVLTRDRVQEVLDDAVERGRMTRADASLLVSELVHRGRRQTEDLLADVEQLLGRSRDQLEDAVDKARRATGLGSSFPIAGYDDLTAAEVTSRLGELTPAELRKVRDYERRNANRKSVLAAVEQRLG
jgi:polyhydroxyalkanoate synthesis regulator phasin